MTVNLNDLFRWNREGNGVDCIYGPLEHIALHLHSQGPISGIAFQNVYHRNTTTTRTRMHDFLQSAGCDGAGSPNLHATATPDRVLSISQIPQPPQLTSLCLTAEKCNLSA